MARDQWEVASTEPDSAARPEDVWQVQSVTLPKGTTAIGPRPRSLGERFQDNFAEGQRSSLLGAAAQAAGVNAGFDNSDYYRQKLRGEQDVYNLASDTDQWWKAPGGVPGKLAAGGATLAGNLAGGAISPESLVGWESALFKNLGTQGLKETAKQAGKAGAKNFAAGAVSDVPIQGLQNAAGTHDGFDPVRPFAAGATNALLPIGASVTGHLLGRGVGAAKDLGQFAGRKILDFVEGLDGKNPVPTRAADSAWEVAAETPIRPAAPKATQTDPWQVASRTPEQTIKPSGDIQSIVRSAADAAGVDPGVAFTIAQLENGKLDPTAKNPTSSAGGLFQFTDATWQAMGGGDKFDAAESARMGAKLLKQNSEALTRQLGRQPEGWELYLAHQQGAQGASALLSNGDLPAVEALQRAGLSAKRARAAVLNNGGRADMTAAEFAGQWREKFNAKHGAQSEAPSLWTPEREQAWQDNMVAEGRMSPREPEPENPFSELPEQAAPAPMMEEPFGPRREPTRAAAALPEPGDVVRFTHQGQRLEGVVSPAMKSGRYVVSGEHGDLYAVHPEDMIHTGRTGRFNVPEQFDTASVPDVLPTRRPLTPENQPLSGTSHLAPELSTDRLGMFAGRNAKTADTSALARAQQMVTQSADPERIRQDTGWHRGDDGAWRFEIPDNTSAFRTEPAQGLFGPKAVGLERLRQIERPGSGIARLGNILDHPQLFEAYPDLRKVYVHVSDMDALASMDGNDLVISNRALRKTPDELRSIITHEIQHWVQGREAHALGAPSNPEGLVQAGYSDALERSFMEGAFPSAARDVYNQSAGEIEARNTQARMSLDAEGRRLTSPDATRDIPRDRSIVVRNTARWPREFPRAEANEWEVAARTPDDGKRAAIDLSAYGNATGALASKNVTGARASQARTVEAGSPEYAKQSVSQLAEQLRKSLGITQRQGRLTLKGGAVGEFDPRSSVIRTKAARHAIDHLSHEAGHKLQHMRLPNLLNAIDNHGPELERLAYEGANPRHIREEGFAEFVRAYLLNPEEAHLRAPNFYDAFETALATDSPRIGGDFRAIQKSYKDLLEGAALEVSASSVAHTGRQPPLAAAKKALVEDGVRPTILAALDEVYRGVFDKKHPFNVWLRKFQALTKENTGRRAQMEMADNPYVLARQAEHAFAMGQSDLQFGVTPYHGIDPEGPSINEVYKKAFGNKQPTEDEDRQFAAYLIGRRMRHEWDRFYRGELEREPDKIEHDKAFHERVVEDAERLHPEWKEAGEMATQFARNLWKLWYDAGMVSEATYKAGIDKHPDYVPVNRDMSDEAAPGGRGRASGVGQYSGGVHGFDGSQRDIIHPLLSLTRQAFEMRAAIARNEVIRAMHSATEKAGDNSGALLEELPAHQVEAMEVDAFEALKAAAKAFGLDERDQSSFSVFQNTELEGLVKATLFMRREMSPRRGEAVVFMWKGGEKTPLLLPDGKLGQNLFSAISGMTKDTRALWEEIAASAAQTLRLGVTGLPEFAVKTTIRDQMAAAMLTDVGFVPFKDLAAGGIHAVKRDAVFKRYAAAGGLQGGVNVAALRRPFPRNDKEARTQLKRLQPHVIPVQGWRELMHLVDIGDTATRLGVFHKALAKAKARGLSDYEAVIEARHTSADFFDPSRHGAWPFIVQAARTIPFMNTGLQGPDVAVRTLRHAFQRPETMMDKAKFAKAWRFAALLAATSVLSATVVAAWHGDPDFENINDQLRATHWPVWKRADGSWVMYPKSFELGAPANLTERILEWMLEGDPKTPERIRKDIFNTLVPTHEATILAVPFQIASNRDRSGKPIVPDHLRGSVDPQYQVNAWTSDTAKRLAGGKVSPAVVEHLITGFLGTMGRDALRLGDAAIHAAEGRPGMKDRLPDQYMTRGFVRRTARSSDSEENFWKLVGKTGQWERASNTLDLMIRDGKTDEAKAYINKLPREVRTYVRAQLVGGDIAKVEPMGRARAAVGVLSALRRENRLGELVGLNGEVIQLSKAQRREVDDALDDMALAEIHNAQVSAGISSWKNRKPMPEPDVREILGRISPEVAQAASVRMLTEGVYPANVSAKVWAKARNIPENMSPKLADLLMLQKQTSTTDGQLRTMRQSAVKRAAAAR